MNTNLCAIIVFALMLGHTVNVLSGETMRLSERDSGSTVEINVGDELEIVLPANPTTGFLWEVNSLNSSALSQGKADYMANTTAIGSGGFEIKRFQAVTPGTSIVKLIFHRLFEQNMPPLKTFEVNVIIKK